MDMDDIQAKPSQPPIHQEGGSQQRLMEEELESFDLGEIEIFSLEQAYKRK